jgi:hypothetical protein
MSVESISIHIIGTKIKKFNKNKVLERFANASLEACFAMVTAPLGDRPAFSGT